jgi:hypothetical protein
MRKLKDHEIKFWNNTSVSIIDDAKLSVICEDGLIKYVGCENEREDYTPD